MFYMRGWKAALAVVGGGLLGSLFSSGAMAEDIQYNMAVLRALDKVTARVALLEVRVGMAIEFGTLQITVRTCRKRAPDDIPETAAFLDISESRPGEPLGILFRGWMFESSPALSALEHPVYDIWVVDCVNK